MKAIIAPTDFSPNSLNAVSYAAGMAASMNASLALLHVVQIPMSFADLPALPGNLEELKMEAELRIQQLREEIKAKSGEHLKIYIEVRVGSVIGEISEYASILSPLVIVMGTTGDSLLSRFLFGSNTLSAMNQLQFPLLIVPPMATFTGIKTIGLASDLDNVVASVPAKKLLNLIENFDAKLIVLHVNEKVASVNEDQKTEESAMLNEMLIKTHPGFQFIIDDDVEDGLLKYAAKNKLDLLVLFHRNQSWIGQVFNKSHSKKLMLHTHLPVMTIGKE